MYGMHSLQNAVFESAQIQRPRVDYSNKVVSYDYFIFDLFLLLFCMYKIVQLCTECVLSAFITSKFPILDAIAGFE